MARLCLSVESRQAFRALLSALRGEGAFRRFKDSLRRSGIQDEWYRYREEAIKQIAIDWCESNRIEFEEE